MPELVTLTTEKQELGEGKVRVSISLPTVQAGAKTPLAKSFSMYYGGMKRGFLRYAAGALLKEAASCAEPVGAVLKAKLCLENEYVVSVYVDSAVSIDQSRTLSRIVSLWDKESGVLIRPNGLYRKGYKKVLLPLLADAAVKRAESAAVPLFSDWQVQLEKHFDKGSFCLSPNGAVYMYQAGVLSDKNDVFPVHINKSCLQNVFKESICAIFW